MISIQTAQRSDDACYCQELYADTPIDASLLSLYVQQNYTLYCDNLDNCDGVIDWLSWIDSNGGDSVRCILYIIFLAYDSDLVVTSQPAPISPGITWDDAFATVSSH